jgi:hypothetical protein
MDILLNDLSLHGQFNTIPDFETAIERIMLMRSVARRHNRAVKVHRRLGDTVIANGLTFPQIIGQLSRGCSGGMTNLT